MNRILLVSCLCWFSASSLFSQIYMKIEPLPGGDSWGVFLKACSDLAPSNNTITGSGQVTIHFDKGLTFTNFTSHAGTWQVNATVTAPNEAPEKVYVSVGFITDNPKIIYHPEYETLLFSFKLSGAGQGQPKLLQNGTDPFDQLPNSLNTNPGNELSAIDFGVTPTGFYYFSGTYTDDQVECTPTVPQDSTVTNPQDSTVVTPPDSTGQTGTTTNIFDLEQSASIFKVSPNPAYDWVSVIFLESEVKGGLIRLWSSNGSVIGALSRGSNEVLRLNLEGLSAGLYFITYELDGKLIQRERLVKQ